MIIRQRNNHNRANDNLAVYNNGSVFDRVHAQHGCLWKVDNGCAKQGTKNASIRADVNSSQKKTKTDGNAGTYMVKVPPAISSRVSFPSRAFLPNAPISFSIPTKLMLSAFLTTGVTSPLGVATATLKST